MVLFCFIVILIIAGKMVFVFGVFISDEWVHQMPYYERFMSDHFSPYKSVVDIPGQYCSF